MNSEIEYDDKNKLKEIPEEEKVVNNSQNKAPKPKSFKKNKQYSKKNKKNKEENLIINNQNINRKKQEQENEFDLKEKNKNKSKEFNPNKNIYIEKKGDLYYVLEKVNDKNIKFWEKFVCKQGLRMNYRTRRKNEPIC